MAKKLFFAVCTTAILLTGTAVSAQPAAELLEELPKTVTAGLKPLFSANSLGFAALMGQIEGTTLNAVLSRVRAGLEGAGYCEENIRTVVNPGNFSMTWAPPKGVVVDGSQDGKYPILGVTAGLTSNTTVNLVLAFTDVLAGSTAVTTACYQDPQKTETKVPVRLPFF